MFARFYLFQNINDGLKIFFSSAIVVCFLQVTLLFVSISICFCLYHSFVFFLDYLVVPGFLFMFRNGGLKNILEVEYVSDICLLCTSLIWVGSL